MPKSKHYIMLDIKSKILNIKGGVGVGKSICLQTLRGNLEFSPTTYIIYKSLALYRLDFYFMRISMQSGVAKLILFGINATTIKIVTYHEHGIFSWLSVIRFQYLWSPIIKNQMTNVVTKVHFLLYYHFYIIFFLSMIYKSMYLLQCIEVKLYRFFYFFILLGNQNIFLCLFFDFFFAYLF